MNRDEDAAPVSQADLAGPPGGGESRDRRRAPWDQARVVEPDAERILHAARNSAITLYEQDRELRYLWLFPLQAEHRHALGRTDLELGTDESRQQLTRWKREVMATGIEQRHEVRVDLESGIRHYDLLISPRHDPSGEVIGVRGAALDITERKAVEQARRESAQRLRIVHDRAPVGIAEVDLEGRFLAVNPRFAQQLGYDAGELIGRSFGEITHPEDAEADLEGFRRLRDGEMPFSHLNKRYIHKAGHAVWLDLTASLIRDEDGRPLFGLAIAQDITDRVRAERRQQAIHDLVARVNQAVAAAEIYEAALEAIERALETNRASILLFDPDGRMRFRAWRRLSAEYRAAVEGQSPWTREQRHPEPICIADTATATLDAPLRAALEREGIRALAFIPLVLEGRLLGKLMLYYDAPRGFDADDLQAAATLASQVAFALARQQDAEALELLVNERTASLQAAITQMEEFSYSVSHDLRAPLRALQGYAYALAEDCGPQLGPEGRDYCERIIHNSVRMERLIRDLLTYSRVSRRDLALSPVLLDSLVREIIRHHPDAQVRQAEIEIPQPLLAVRAHEPSLNQILSNLLSNAVKFVRPGVPPRVQIGTERDGGEVRIWIRDNGIGIKPDHQPRLFGMFERLHPELGFDGTGIGLAIVRKAAERMGGRTGCESDGVNGSRFWITLPAADLP